MSVTSYDFSAEFTAGTVNTARRTETAPRASLARRLLDRVIEARMRQVKHMLVQRGYQLPEH
ncbi:MAG TPA: hypothetical protein VLA00_13140 [Xanthobacteraceae bacterium]|nr:hypothetical protein [Xanthobacteraceae bacterium]